MLEVIGFSALCFVVGKIGGAITLFVLFRNEIGKPF